LKYVDIDLKAQPFELLFPQDRIEQRIRDLGRRISADYAGKNLVILGVLKGSFIFVADLIRNISVPLVVEFISANSYGSTTDPGQLIVSGGPIRSLRDRHVLLVEGVVDTGRTARSVMTALKRLEPSSVEIVTLLNKTSRREENLTVKYYGFDVGDDFVIGYGLDHNQLYRNLPFIGKVIMKQKG
jgi:hypoxanthine phosphoribosyltransferase